MSDLYKKYPFISLPTYERHPDFARALLELCEVRTKEWSSVLEIGCGRGSYLNCLAKLNPGKKFTGVDSSTSSIEEARENAKRLELSNIQFLEEDFLSSESKIKAHDVVLVYGLFSWISTNERRKLFNFINNHLFDSGFCIINHNLLPGWKSRGELIDFISKDCKTPTEVRGRLEEISSGSFFGLGLKSEAENILKIATDSFIVHEILNPKINAVSSDDFREFTNEFGLQVVDMEEDLKVEALPPFLGSEKRSIRNVVLVKETNKISEEQSFIKNAWFTSKFVGLEEEDAGKVFFSPSGDENFFEDKNVQIVLRKLSDSWPCSLSLDDLSEGLEESEVLECLKKLIAGRAVEAYARKLNLTGDLTEKPKVHEISLLNNLFPGAVVNERFEFVKLSDEVLKVLELCVGQNTVPEISTKTGISLEETIQILGAFSEMALTQEEA